MLVVKKRALVQVFLRALLALKFLFSDEQAGEASEPPHEAMLCPITGD